MRELKMEEEKHEEAETASTMLEGADLNEELKKSKEM